jgi:hypothetical protein
MNINAGGRASSHCPIRHLAILNHQLWLLAIWIFRPVVHSLSNLKETTHLSLELFQRFIALLVSASELVTQLGLERQILAMLN